MIKDFINLYFTFQVLLRAKALQSSIKGQWLGYQARSMGCTAFLPVSFAFNRIPHSAFQTNTLFSRPSKICALHLGLVTSLKI